MLKKVLLLSGLLTILIAVIACSSSDLVNDSIDTTSELLITIVDITDVQHDDWFGKTVLANSDQGQLVFNHEHLEDIDVSVGNIVRITTTGVWLETAPMQVDVISWELVED